jgi:hypothetical protein
MTVEELREKLYGLVEGWVGQICGEFCGYSQEEIDSCDKEEADAKADIDSLISAAEAQGEAKGYAEGAEEERQRIMDDCADALFTANKPHLTAMLKAIKGQS